ncbi:uncharacterized protein LOC112526727 [Cynara cardunculus var. scolymus]|uniref:Uncharacterized protein n=1 Tax=Cynara cardunculus var. scolymus TaxID=59895 RepID=A0A118K4Z0_CYNCS|nr:uncharacterized protein LOC112526727 [Cynara cardunculus var. scolymus]KVI08282.1 hypothetical protein Ccrd_013346 [Cynara cardunculus var. scolymus]
MNPSVNSLNHSPCRTTNPSIKHFATASPKWFHHHPHISTLKPHIHRPTTFTTFCSLRRRRHFRRRRHPDSNSYFPTTDADFSSPHSDSKLHMVIDLEQYIPDSTSLNKLLKVAELKFNQFVDSGSDAVEDLRTMITIDGDRRVVVSCRKTTVYFVGQLIALSWVTIFAFRVLVKIGLGFRNLFMHQSNDSGGVVTRRDRSLGGREVVVSTQKESKKELNVSVNPLSSGEESIMSYSNSMMKNWEKSKKKLPDWWPDSRPAPLEGIDKEENQKKANWLIGAIMDYRTSGKDIQEDDIILLRRICRMSGVRVSIDTPNSRDSIYRASVDFTLNTCGRIASHSTIVQIDGEDAREFIAGLADNIGLESIRAARMVAAAVAARTRSWLLQAWALEMQGKHIEAAGELSKLCLIHRIFPPEEGSPEMEMVARGLEKHLKLEQREYLLRMLMGVSSEENRRSLVEALGLAMSGGSIGDQQENIRS